jgi:hypothetical protein
MRLADTVHVKVRKNQDAYGTNGANFVDRLEQFNMGTVVQDKLRTVIRGSPKSRVPREPWICEVLVRQKKTLKHFPNKRHKRGFGIAVYHLRRESSSASPWDAIRAAVESHVSSWGKGVDGSEEVKPLLELHWFDDVESVDEAKRLVFTPWEFAPREQSNLLIIRTSGESVKKTSTKTKWIALLFSPLMSPAHSPT